MARHGVGGYLASGSVLAVTAAFLAYAIVETRDGAGEGGRRYGAVFSSTDGLSAGAPVTLGGVVVGRVDAIRLDTRTMASDVTFDLRREIALPADSNVAVSSAALGGGGALAITPGHSGARLAPGTAITDTTPSRSLEAAVGDYIFGAGIGSAR